MALVAAIQEDKYADNLPEPAFLRDPETDGSEEDYAEALERARRVIHQARDAGPLVTACSGGTDSVVLVDIVAETLGPQPLVFCDTGMEYPETRPFVEEIARIYQAPLLIARPAGTPLDCWQRKGWPFLGKLPARLWMQKHRGRSYGFRLNVTACCHAHKLAPVRKLIKAEGFRVKLAGIRGDADDKLRGFRAHRDGAIYRNRESGTIQAHPLLGWTDGMVRKYTRDRRLPRHPLKARGIITTGCMYCGGGCQFSNSGYRILRHINPEAWRRFFVEWRAGEILLAIKHDRPLWLVQRAVQELGGLDHLAATRPALFDFCRLRPRQGYVK